MNGETTQFPGKVLKVQLNKITKREKERQTHFLKRARREAILKRPPGGKSIVISRRAAEPVGVFLSAKKDRASGRSHKKRGRFQVFGGIHHGRE